ncbi:MAG: Thermostable beta-glucosidase B [Promethearchaeota archaeon]|nr:MAG: Thermostable beta-glucosidase B [Candidatus Lokiarchaeota archaeon]
MSRETIRQLDWGEFIGKSEEEIDQQAQKIVESMTLKEKAEQMAGDNSLLHAIGMLIRYNKNPIPAGVNKELDIPGVLFADGPRGVVLNNSTCFPVSMARGATWDIELEEKIGEIIGIEAKSQGANFFGGVCINLLRHPAWGRAQETYGEDSYHLGEMGSALVRGTQKHLMACAKHYACNSMENARFKVSVNIDERTLREVYLAHFKKCVDEGVASIMNAYNRVNGKYCGHNPHLLREILKQDWDFPGFVITDFVWGIREGKQAIKAGVDIEMPFHWKMKSKKIVKWVENGEIDEDIINEAVLRILRQKMKFAGIQDPEKYNPENVASEENTKVALEAAQKSIVLLKNENNLLPLKKNTLNQIAIIGKLAKIENIGDKGSSRVYPPYVVTPYEGVKQEAGDELEILYSKGDNIEKARKIASQADIAVIVVGYTHKDEGEYVYSKGGDRDSLRLSLEDEELIQAISEVNMNCIVVMEGGSAIITEAWRDKVSVMLMAWYPGMEGGTALADIIFGNISPSAKLPVVFPKSQDQLPFFDKDANEIEYGYYHGYKLMDKNGYEPAFPFGFGLSYCTYTYSNLKVEPNTIKKGDSVKVKVDVKNEGEYEGWEIVQVYIGYSKSAVDRPIKELKGFGKIKLFPSEQKTIQIEINSKELGYYDVNKKTWVIEKITYELFVGPSSEKEKLLKTTFKIE